MKYSLSPREIPWALPSGFPSSSGYISSYIPPLVCVLLVVSLCFNIYNIYPSSRQNTDTKLVSPSVLDLSYATEKFTS